MPAQHWRVFSFHRLAGVGIFLLSGRIAWFRGIFGGMFSGKICGT